MKYEYKNIKAIEDLYWNICDRYNRSLGCNGEDLRNVVLRKAESLKDAERMFVACFEKEGYIDDLLAPLKHAREQAKSNLSSPIVYHGRDIENAHIL